jgi:hypothetical protein
MEKAFNQILLENTPYFVFKSFSNTHGLYCVLYTVEPTERKNYSHLDKQNSLTTPDNNPVNTAYRQAKNTS